MRLTERIARTYIDASNRGDHAAMADLFHPDAEWIPIAPIPPRQGADAIRQRYLTDVKAMNAPIVNAVYTADDERCVVEFQVDHPEKGIVPVVDVFTIDAGGLITRLAVYGSESAPPSNPGARAQLQELADEQAALRRVAELVARGEAPQKMFTAVANEASALMQGQAMTLTRYEDDGALVVVAVCEGPAPMGARFELIQGALPDRARRTARAVRVDDYTGEPDEHVARAVGLNGCVGAPVVVDGRVWGLLTATSPPSAPRLPDGTEERLEQFAGLVAAAIANAEKHEQLIASRARLVATADETRHRLQRDVHDGAQQRLVQTVVALKFARQALAEGRDGASELLDEALEHAQRANAELRDVVRGILPAALTQGGLRAGLESLVEGLPLPVVLDVPPRRLPPALETTAYFVVAEALTNVVKHAGAREAKVTATLTDSQLEVEVSDDGRGGADPGSGSGLTGLFDRVEARGGTLLIGSTPGAGTSVTARLPVERPASG